MKSAELIDRSGQEHLEWEDETEACEEDLASMGKCVISMGIGVILTIGVSLYFLLA